MTLKGKKITVHDMTLRDGMHPKRHLMTLEQMTSHRQRPGRGRRAADRSHPRRRPGRLARSTTASPPTPTRNTCGAVIPLMKQAKVSALLLPGIGTVDHLKMARDLGVHTIRVATHCTEADVSEQHITMARKMDMDTVGFLMMAHMNSAEGLVKQAKLMEGYGANCIYITDSAGYMLPDDVKARLGAVRDALEAGNRTGLPRPPQPGDGRGQLASPPSRSAPTASTPPPPAWAPAPATRRWKCWSPCATAWASRPASMSAKIQDVAEDLVVPIMDFPIRIDRDALTLGYAGVYGSFLLFAKRADDEVRRAGARHPGRTGPARHGRRPGRHDRGHRADHGPRTRPRRNEYGEGQLMKLDKATIAKLAEHLETCELEAQDTLKITDDHPDMDWDDAYAIQDVIKQRKLARGGKVVGLKAGLTSHAKMKQMGVDTPCFGFVADSYAVPDGGEVKVAELIHPKVEPEICFVTQDGAARPGLPYRRRAGGHRFRHARHRGHRFAATATSSST